MGIFLRDLSSHQSTSRKVIIDQGSLMMEARNQTRSADDDDDIGNEHFLLVLACFLELFECLQILSC